MWCLSGKSVITYLLNRGFPIFTILGETCSISESLGSNRNTIIKISGNDLSLIFKQAQNLNTSFINSIRNESSFYDIISTSKFKYSLTETIFFDISNNLLVYICPKNVNNVTLKIFQEESRLNAFKFKASNQLFQYHSHFQKSDKISLIAFYKPRILVPDKFNEIIQDLKNVNNIYCEYWAEKIEEERETFKLISKMWNKNDTIIHRDVKVENFLEQNGDYYLIDWELVSKGDRFWDLSEFLFNYLRQEVYEYNIELDPHLQIHNLKSCCRGFIQTYWDLYKNGFEMSEYEFYKKLMVFFVIRQLDYFVGCTTYNKWDKDKIYLESKRINKYWEILENCRGEKKDDFPFKKYLM